MNKIEMAEYVSKEFLHNGESVVAVERGEGSLEAVILYSNGKRQAVNGKIAVDLLHAADA